MTPPLGAERDPAPNQARPRIGPNGRPVRRPGNSLLATLERRLEQISAGAQVPLIARLPNNQSMLIGMPDPSNQTLKEYWLRLWNADLMHKWHDGVLVMSPITWALEAPPPPGPYMLVYPQYK